MNSSSSSRRAASRGAVAALFVAVLAVGGAAQAQEALRPEIGKPLQAAQEMIKSQRYKEALGKVREAQSRRRWRTAAAWKPASQACAGC